MYYLKLKCRLITPMFMYGADGKTPELRPSEFKGMMRWWWRAIRGEDNIKNLKEKESEIFGGSGTNQGKSKINISVYPNILKSSENISREFDKTHDGLRYLYYSTFTLKERGTPIIRKYINPDEQFGILTSALNLDYFFISIATLWAAIFLGGFGLRSRRGGGNLSIENAHSNSNILNELSFSCKAKTPQELKKWFEKNISIIKEICEQKGGATKYTNINSGSILVFHPQNSWKNALNFLGVRLKNFRENNKDRIFELAAFGMPVMHSKFSVRMVPFENQKRELSDRWASPLIFKVIYSNGLFFPTVVRLNPGGINFIGKQIKEKGRWENEKVISFDLSKLNEFINNLKNYSGVEVLDL